MKAKLIMTTRFVDPDGDKQIVDTNVDCEYSFFCGCAKIAYEEKNEEGAINVVMDLSPSKIKIERGGFLRYSIELKKGEPLEGEILTPYGAMPTKSELHSYRAALSEKGAEFEFEYSFFVDENGTRNIAKGKVAVE